MKRFPHLIAATAIAAAGFATTLPATAQDGPTTAVVSIYRIAPGKHLDFLKWMAAREAAAKEAGAAPTQWYTHMDGDSWDYVAIGPDQDAMSDQADAAAAKRGLTTGMRAGLELRQMMASHTDTIAAGPYSAQQLVDEAGR